MGATQGSLDHWEMVMPELNFLGLWFEPILYRHGAQYMCGAVRLACWILYQSTRSDPGINEAHHGGSETPCSAMI